MKRMLVDYKACMGFHGAEMQLSVKLWEMTAKRETSNVIGDHPSG